MPSSAHGRDPDGLHPTSRLWPLLRWPSSTTRRRHALLVDVTQAASEVSRLVHEARDLHLPVEPGIREGRAVLLEEVLP
jgi:hypothetical protein